jgi:hypothetical protein
VPNNNSILLKKSPGDEIYNAYKPFVRGGAISFDVDISSVGCGCVAGMYALHTSDKCGEDPMDEGYEPSCASIDIMQANHAGFNVAAHPCANGDCDAASKCSYDMSVDGKAKYGDDAYGIMGTLIDTSMVFNVKTEFVASPDYSKLHKLRTRLTQGENEIVMEASCPEYLEHMGYYLNGNMAFVISSWDNRDYKAADFECKGTCPAPAESCENATFTVQDIQVN